jgi:cytochrome c biogenesis protein CcmG/thiol:disulfide interchange protein DsbE
MRRTALWSALGVALLGALLIAVLATRSPAVERLADSPLLGKPAPVVSGRSLDGSTVRLSDFRGQYVVLNFFATWCVPCRNEHPELQSFRNRHLSTGDVEVLAVVFDDDMGDVRRFFEREGGDWPVIDDPRGKVALDFGVRGPPESFLIDPNGYVLTRIVGEVRADGLDNLLEQATKGDT